MAEQLAVLAPVHLEIVFVVDVVVLVNAHCQIIRNKAYSHLIIFENTQIGVVVLSVIRKSDSNPFQVSVRHIHMKDYSLPLVVSFPLDFNISFTNSCNPLYTL